MKPIQRYADFDFPAELLWRWLSDVSNWGLLSDAFVGKKGRFDYRLAQGAPPLPGTALSGPGNKLLALDKSGRTVMELDVAAWEPPHKMVLQSEQKGFLGFKSALTIEIQKLITGSTRIYFELKLDFGNPVAEGFLSILPVEWLYGRALKKMLDVVRAKAA